MALTVGVLAGLVAAQYGGWVDDLVTFVVNLFTITPTFYVLLILAAWVPPSLVSLALLIAAFGWMGVTRQVRGVSLSIARRDYVALPRERWAQRIGGSCCATRAAERIVDRNDRRPVSPHAQEATRLDFCCR